MGCKSMDEQVAEWRRAQRKTAGKTPAQTSARILAQMTAYAAADKKGKH